MPCNEIELKNKIKKCLLCVQIWLAFAAIYLPKKIFLIMRFLIGLIPHNSDNKIQELLHTKFYSNLIIEYNLPTDYIQENAGTVAGIMAMGNEHPITASELELCGNEFIHGPWCFPIFDSTPCSTKIDYKFEEKGKQGIVTLNESMINSLKKDLKIMNFMGYYMNQYSNFMYKSDTWADIRGIYIHQPFADWIFNLKVKKFENRSHRLIKCSDTTISRNSFKSMCYWCINNDSDYKCKCASNNK